MRNSIRPRRHNGIIGFTTRRLNKIDYIEIIIKQKQNIYDGTTTAAPTGRINAGPCVMCAYGAVDIAFLD
jgi:hypothetical protein